MVGTGVANGAVGGDDRRAGRIDCPHRSRETHLVKYVAAILMVLLAGGAALLPAPAAVEHGSNPATQVPPVSICPLRSGSGLSTDVSVISSANTHGTITTFSSGLETGSQEFRTSDSGVVTIDAAEAGAIGVSAGLVEISQAATAAGVLIEGSSARAAETCVDVPSDQVFLSGGSTASGAVFEVQLVNPYAGEALVDLTVTSDAGIESDDRFDAVRVPPFSTIALDMSEIIPGRERISASVEITRGSALAMGSQTLDGRMALWKAVEPAQEWWLPIPEGGGTKQLVLATPSNIEIEYQIDYYDSQGLQESFRSGALDPRGQVRVGLAAISPDTAGMRIISTGPVVPSLWIDSDRGLAMTTGSPEEASAWLLPGATRHPGGGSASLVVLNTGVDDVTVDLLALRPTMTSRSFVVPAESVTEEGLTPAGGYRVEAGGPVVVLWTSDVEETGTVAIGIPIQDG